MGRRGPKKQPTAIVKDKGYYRPSRHKSDVDSNGSLEFVSSDNLPMPPKHFTKDLSEIWIQELSHIGLTFGWVGFVDLPMFEQWCICFDECTKLKVLCDSSDRWTETDKGKVMNPVFKELREAQKLLTKISSEFGFTPSSRAGIKLQQPIEQEKEQEYKI